ncbi:MAG: TorF family putative porin [Rubrivivax sp.]|nr:TorF family putative porin [Rubrivivax sp.]
MNKLAPALLAVAAGLCALPGVSFAQAPAASSLAFNVGAVSDYRYRGISQTRGKPALQGGVDYSRGGFYAGAWASNVKWIKDFGGDADIEVDLYGGFKGELTPGVGFDVGVLTYVYPGNKLKPIGGADADTTEIYGALSYGPVTLKYSHAVTDTFGNLDSDGSSYLDLSATFDVGGLSVVPHVGHQRISGPLSGPGSYTDYSLTVSKDFNGVVVSGAVIGTDADKAFYASPVNGKALGKSTFVLGVKYNF